jgi:hypothetical protein
MTVFQAASIALTAFESSNATSERKSAYRSAAEEKAFVKTLKQKKRTDPAQYQFQ